MFGQAMEASVKIDKENRPAVMIHITKSQEISEDALKNRLERSGLKDRIQRGEGIYKGVVFSEISPEKLDIYTKVEKASNNSSTVYMAVSRGYDNFSNNTSDSLLIENVKSFLESFVQDADNQFADEQISGKISDLKKERKSYELLLKKQIKLQEEKRNIENQLAAVQGEIDAKKTLLENQQINLNDAKDDRGKTPY